MLLSEVDNVVSWGQSGPPRLSSPIFKLGTRLVCGLNGSVWAGTPNLTNHLRTMLEDGPQGANAQSTSILLNLHTAACIEGHLPQVFHIGADNTPKETKNGTTMCFIIWLLCALMDTPLQEVQVHFLMVGHTHNDVVPHGIFQSFSVACKARSSSGLVKPARS